MAINTTKFIKNVNEKILGMVNVNSILSNDTYSLNSKDYNKTDIIVGDDFELVKLGDICKYQPKSKKLASYGKDEGLYNFYTSSSKIQKCNEADYKNECLIIGNGGVANINIDKLFSCSADNFILSSEYNNYIYYLFKLKE